MSTQSEARATEGKYQDEIQALKSARAADERAKANIAQQIVRPFLSSSIPPSSLSFLYSHSPSSAPLFPSTDVSSPLRPPPTTASPPSPANSIRPRPPSPTSPTQPPSSRTSKPASRQPKNPSPPPPTQTPSAPVPAKPKTSKNVVKPFTSNLRDSTHRRTRGRDCS
jgi:hypothetical protein